MMTQIRQSVEDAITIPLSESRQPFIRTVETRVKMMSSDALHPAERTAPDTALSFRLSDD